MKQYCATHHLYYESSVCPFCQSEHHERLEKAYQPKKTVVKKFVEQKDDKPIEITDDVLSKLQNHFKK
jgi:hypothetical protein